jgi:hypothetical protein
MHYMIFLGGFQTKIKLFITALLCVAVLTPVFAKGSGEAQSKRIIVTDTNGNPKLGFQIALDTAGLIGYADALVKQGTIDKNPGEALFAPQFKGSPGRL